MCAHCLNCLLHWAALADNSLARSCAPSCVRWNKTFPGATSIKLDDELLAPRILFTSTFAAHSSSVNINLLLHLYIYPQVQPESPYHFWIPRSQRSALLNILVPEFARQELSFITRFTQRSLFFHPHVPAVAAHSLSLDALFSAGLRRQGQIKKLLVGRSSTYPERWKLTRSNQ